MNENDRKSLKRYLVAVALIGFAIIAQLILRTFIDHAVFVLLYPAVFLVAWLAGFGPALLAIGIAASFAGFEFLKPTAIPDLARILIFVGASVFVSWVVARGRRVEMATRSAIREGEESLKRAQEIAHLGSWELDLNTNHLTWSDEVYRIFGLNPQEFAATYEAFLKGVHPEDRESVDAAYSGSLREGRDSYEIEHRVVRKSTGEVRFVHEKCYHLRDATGRIAKSQGMVHDITERKQAEERFRTLADNISQLAWMARPDGWIFWYNKRWFEYTGTTLEEMQGSGWQKVLHPQHARRVVEKSSHAFKAGERCEDMFPIRRKDGTYCWFLSSIIPIRDDAGNVTRWFGTNTDIEKQKEAEENLAKAIQARDEMISVLSHDLKTPLAAIDLNADLLLRKLPSSVQNDSVVKKTVAAIKQSTHRTRALISDLLDISRIESGRLALQPRECDVKSVVREALGDLRLISEARGIRLHERLSCPNESIVCDINRISQVFSNLVGNAIKFVPEKNGVIEVGCSSLGDEVTFYVKDNGPGVDQNALPHIFDRFWQARQAHRAGAGLGLAIAHGIVSAHYGRTWVESNPGKGATFYFVLPTASSAAARRLLESAKIVA